MNRISDSTVRRLSFYLRRLRELERQERELVSSGELAERSGTTSAQVRKDLSLFGSFGTRGRGYEVGELTRTLEGILGLTRRWRVAVVGAGRIGTALLGYRDLEKRGFDVVAAFDTDPDKAGREVSGVRIYPAAELERVVAENRVEVAILAVPPHAAPDSVRRLAGAGVRGILSFAPAEPSPPPGVALRTVDLALELEGLSFLLASADGKPGVDGKPSADGKSGADGKAAADGGAVSHAEGAVQESARPSDGELTGTRHNGRGRGGSR